jgi:hypothetical protein
MQKERKKSFNTTGPCRPGMHYMLPPASRLRQADLVRFVEEELYWVLHAPRQTGKTSFLISWMHDLNAKGDVVACYVSVERCQGIEDEDKAMPAIHSAICQYAKDFGVPIPEIDRTTIDATSLLAAVMQNWAELCAPKPLVVLYDEVDVLSGPALISFLRQLRGGFASRGVGNFPVSVALVGMRDLKDYLVHSKDGQSVNPGSPFNIKEDSFTLRNFHSDEVCELLRQHTDATGQIFNQDALELLFTYSQGQPWLVNALAKECVLRLVPDVAEPITVDHIEKAKEQLILSRATHIDSLAERLKDPKVKKVIQPILAGELDPTLAEGDEFRYCMDLGLVALVQGNPAIANPVYREVLFRTLNYGQQLAIPPPEFKWQHENGDLDLEALFNEFSSFWRFHGDAWEQKADYIEIFPHLLLMAFFQRVLNGGARLTREAAVGRERIDMLIEWKSWKHILEIKLVHPRRSRTTTLEMGLKQIASYKDKVHGDATQTLVIFDRTKTGKKLSWAKRLRTEQHGDVVVRWF